MSDTPRDQDPPSAAGRAAGPAVPRPAAAGRLSAAKPDSTVTLMVQSGQAPGGLTPGRARTEEAAQAPPAPGLFARWWAALKRWF